MIPKGLFTQIAMVIVSIAIIVAYVQPAFGEIGEVQDKIGELEEVLDSVSEVSDDLDSLVGRMESVTNDQEQRLVTYMPDAVDEIHVPRDLLLISQESGLLYKSSAYTGELIEDVYSDPDDVTTTNPIAHSFTLSAEGTYGQIVDFFTLVEQNNYPLEVHGIVIEKLDGGFLQVEIQFVTYSYQRPDASNVIDF